MLSIVFAAIAGGSLWRFGTEGGDWLFLVIAAVCIQLRLLCNMVDGLLAVEGGMKSSLGDLYNEIPDRIADALILIGAGYAVRSLAYGEMLGWLAALVAMMTAYVRLLAGSLGAKQLFIGPMAKQHRMFVVTVACLAAAVEYAMRGTMLSLYYALILVVLGTAFTIVRRIVRLADEIKSR